MSELRLDRMYAINAREVQSVPEQLVYEPLPKNLKQNPTLSAIAPSEAQRELLSLRPQLKPPIDGHINLKTETNLRELATLKTATHHLLENVDEVKEAVDAAIACKLTETQKKHFFLLILELHNTVEEVSQRHLAHISQQIRVDSAELEQLNVKKTEELKKYAETVKDQETWSSWSVVGEYVASAASFVIGGLLIATGAGAVAGAFVLAAGGVGLLNRVLTDTGAVKIIVGYFIKSSEMQEKMAHWISSSLFFVSIGLGLVGGVATWECSGFRLLDTALGTKKIIEKIGLAVGIATAGVKLRESWVNKEMMATMAALTTVDGKLFQMRQDLQQQSAEAKRTIETMQILTKQTNETISSLE